MCGRTLMVLAGGYGTRLRPVTGTLPKPLVDCKGVPFLSRVFDKWESAGFDDYLFLIGYGASQMKDWIITKRMASGSRIRWITEKEKLGTGGAIINAVKKEARSAGLFCLTNADTWVDADLSLMLQTDLPSMAVKVVTEAGRYGVVKIDHESRVIGFGQKPDCDCQTHHINLGFYTLPYSFFSHRKVGLCSFEEDLMPQLITEYSLDTKIFSGDFIDIGIPDDYRAYIKSLGN